MCENIAFLSTYHILVINDFFPEMEYRGFWVTLYTRTHIDNNQFNDEIRA